jgi:putative aldouronate transport system substrate-binding protein
VNLNSPADNQNGFELQQTFEATVQDVVTGKKPYSALASAVKTWQNGGGNTIRSQYEQALSASTGKSATGAATAAS